MSMRPRKPKNAEKPQFGSIHSAPVDFNSRFAQQTAVGVTLIDERNTFFVEMYFGDVKKDTIMLPNRPESGMYLRFKIGFLNRRSDRKSIAKHIIEEVSKKINDFFYTTPIENDSYVCGNPADSFYAIGFIPKEESTDYVNDFYELGQAIAGVPQDTPFNLEGDKHNYVYTIDTDGDDKAEMTIKRV